MRSFKSFCFALLFLPLLSFAQMDEVKYDATYENVSVGCYGAFRTIFSMFPEITDAINQKVGQELIVVSDVRTPLSNPSTFTMTVTKTPTGNGIGDYKLYQKYTGTTLYLRVDLLPETYPEEKLDMVWMAAGKLFAACPL